jgi:hypothetical protein
MMAESHRQVLVSVMEALRCGMASFRVDDFGGTMVTPVIYRTGTSVTLRVTVDGSFVRVSDDGRAYIEALKYGAHESLERIAKRHVGENIGFVDGRVFCSCDIEMAVWAAVMVSNVSARILDDALNNREIKRQSDFGLFLKEMLIRAFGPMNVTRARPVLGASGEPRHPDYKLSAGGHTGYVKLVRPSRRSVESAVTMYHDIMLMPKAPSFISAVEDAGEFGPKLKLLASWSHIIDKKTKPESIPDLIKEPVLISAV